MLAALRACAALDKAGDNTPPDFSIVPNRRVMAARTSGWETVLSKGWLLGQWRRLMTVLDRVVVEAIGTVAMHSSA